MTAIISIVTKRVRQVDHCKWVSLLLSTRKFWPCAKTKLSSQTPKRDYQRVQNGPPPPPSALPRHSLTRHLYPLLDQYLHSNLGLVTIVPPHTTINEFTIFVAITKFTTTFKNTGSSNTAGLHRRHPNVLHSLTSWLPSPCCPHTPSLMTPVSIYHYGGDPIPTNNRLFSTSSVWLI